MYDSERGKIKFRDRARQIIDFSGIRYGNITPTDIDGLIEYHDKVVVFLEYKYDDNKLPYGQQLALERLANNCHDAGKKSTVIVAEHYVHDCNNDICAADAIVRDFYYDGKWYHDGKAKVKEKIDSFIKFVDEDPF